MVHTQPTEAQARCGPAIPPTQLVNGSYSAYGSASALRSCNPTNAVGEWFILSLRKRKRAAVLQSHQRSWWMVHTQPTEAQARCGPAIPPTQLVDGSYSAYGSASALRS